MLLSIVSKEIKEIHREKRLRLLLVTFGLLLVVMLIAGFADWRREQTIRENAANADREMWLGQQEKNPHDAAHYGMYVFRPTSVLSMLDPGVNPFVGNSLFLEAHRRNESGGAAILDESGLARFGALSPRFLILTILPLFLILLGFDAFTREREGETLPMLTVHGLSPAKLAAGKYLTQLALCLILLAPIAILSAAVAQGFDGGVELLKSLGLLLGIYFLLLATFSALVLTVSLWSPSSRFSLIALLSIWFAMTLALPRLTTNLAEERYPYPTHTEFQARIAELKKQGLDGHNPYNEAAKAFEKETLEKYGVEKVEDLPINFAGLLAQKGEEYESEVYATQYGQIEDQYGRQLTLFSKAAILSPFLATRFASMALCRTDDPAHWHFSEAAEEHRLAFNRVLNMDNAQNATYGDYSYRANSELWAKVPPFDYQLPTLSAVFPRVSPFLITLTLQFLACLGLYYVSAFRRGLTRY